MVLIFPQTVAQGQIWSASEPIKTNLRRSDPSQTFSQHKSIGGLFTKTELRMPETEVKGAMCVQRFDDSLNPAIHITYRISLRSSSYQEPRDPSLSDMVVLILPIKGII